LVKVAGQDVAAGACALAATTDEIGCEADALFLVAQAIGG
jgi:hypothetical protein